MVLLCKKKICFQLVFFISLILVIIIPLIIPKYFTSISETNLYILQIFLGLFFYSIMSYTFIKYWEVFRCNVIHNSLYNRSNTENNINTENNTNIENNTNTENNINTENNTNTKNNTNTISTRMLSSII
jgi:uncharacterized membrane protein